MDHAGAMFSIVLIFFALFIHGNFCEVLDDEEFEIGDGLKMRVRVLNGSEMIDTLRELGFNEEADEMEAKTINDGEDYTFKKSGFEMEAKTINYGRDYTFEKSGFEANLINEDYKNQERDLDNLPLVPTITSYKNIRIISVIGAVVLVLFIFAVLYICKLVRERSNDLNQYPIDKKKLISASVYQV